MQRIWSANVLVSSMMREENVDEGGKRNEP